ncbi:hypothetical protein [Ectopseudomonas hydrolytica]|uniref:hypothetical protein n=1 Tax=Ectopseudomonas hydrolytica TaxID=2493633 RepID=UPI00376EBA2E
MSEQVRRFMAPTNDTCDMDSYQQVVLAADHDSAIQALRAEAEALRAELFATKQKLSVAQRFSPRVIQCNCGEYVAEGYLCACERGIL